MERKGIDTAAKDLRNGAAEDIVRLVDGAGGGWGVLCAVYTGRR